MADDRNNPDAAESLLVQKYCHGQFTDEEIAGLIGISESELFQRYEAHLERWRTQAQAEVRSSLLEQAKKGTIPAIVFFLKHFGGVGDATDKQPGSDEAPRHGLSPEAIRQMDSDALEQQKALKARPGAPETTQ